MVNHAQCADRARRDALPTTGARLGVDEETVAAHEDRGGRAERHAQAAGIADHVIHDRNGALEVDGHPSNLSGVPCRVKPTPCRSLATSLAFRLRGGQHTWHPDSSPRTAERSPT